MSELTSWIPIASLIVAVTSVVLSFLTYRRVTRKYYSRTVPFEKTIKPKENAPLFDIEGSGFLQKIELQAWGSIYGVLNIDIDDLTIFRKTIHDLSAENSSYIRFFSGMQNGYCSLEMPLERNFFKKIEINFDNTHAQDTITIKGAIALNINQTKTRRFFDTMRS